MEAKRNQADGMAHVNQVVLDIAKEFETLSGRKYGLFEAYRMEDAERAVIIIGSAAGTTKDAVDRLREQGEKVGMIKIRLYRPFPADELAEALKDVKAVAIMDRSESYTNHGGPLGADVMSALFRARSKALAINYIYGLGGRDVRVEDMEEVYATLKQVIADDDAGEMYRYMGLR
jgi:pyruvate ferredoxin oxidoreductase alpha subunit